MKKIQFGLVLADFRVPPPIHPSDPVDVLVLRSTLINPPRVKAAEQIAKKIRKTYKNVQLIPYVWHLVSHPPTDALSSMGTRSIAGDPHKFGHLQSTDEVHRAWEITLQSANALQAKNLILATPLSFTPTQENCQRIHTFSQACAKQGIQLWWEATGLWQHQQLLEIASRSNLLISSPAFDRTGRIVNEQSFSQCLVVESTGAVRKLKAVMAESLAIAVDCPNAENVKYLLFAGEKAINNLHTFAKYF